MSPKTIGAYFAIFLIQYIPSLVFKGFTLFQQVTGESVAHTAIKVIEASGPIGIGSAMNALAVAVFVEAVMVLAKMLSKQQREEGIKEGRKRANAKWRAWAKEKGIPLEELPIDDEPEDDE